ncbi:MAG: tetratricopeptide repeat protein [Pseudomonadota bacterium]
MKKYLLPLFLLTLISATLSLSGCTKQGLTTNTTTVRTSPQSPDVEALYNQGIDFYNNRYFIQAAQKFREAAKQGHAKAQFRLAALYRFGSGVQKDLDQAIHWYRKAAEQGNLDAQLSLGMMYYKGIEIPRNLEEAEKWLSLAADQGNQDARDKLEKVQDELVK